MKEGPSHGTEHSRDGTARLMGQGLAQLAEVHPAELSALENPATLPGLRAGRAIAKAPAMDEEELSVDFPDRMPLRNLAETKQSRNGG